jgi:hypothetical protein
MTLPEIAAWIASAISLTSVWLYGSKNRWGPVLGSLALFPWITVAVCGPIILWGLVPANVAFTILHALNLRKWVKEAVSDDIRDKDGIEQPINKPLGLNEIRGEMWVALNAKM